MKIGILTWSQEVNHGAVLQTYAIYQSIIHLGHNPVVLDYQANDNNMDNMLSKRIKRIFSRLRPDKLFIRYQLKEWTKDKSKLFETFRNRNLTMGCLYSDEPGLDKVVIGSDMVFDFYEGYNPFMYGKDVKCDYLFSYAASFGYTTESIIESYLKKDEIIKYIQKLKNVSFRDNNTGMILRNICGITNLVKAIDPVMLYGFCEERINWNKHKWAERKYILVYSYTYNMDDLAEIRAVKNYAKKHKLEIISVGYIHLWCDQSVNADPIEFVELIQNAEIIITDTYHGTIFSLTFEKQFIVIIRNNAFKIVDILSDLDLIETINGTIEQKLQKIEYSPIDYKIVSKRIQKLRDASMRFLSEQINA